MLETILHYLLWITAIHSPFILLLLACRKKLRQRYTAGAVYLLWLLLLARMVISYSPSISYLPTPAPVDQSATGQVAANNNQGMQEIPVFQPGEGMQETPAGEENTPLPVNLWPTLALVWLGGAVVYGGFQLAAAVRFKRLVRRRAVPQTDPQALAILQQQCGQLGVRRAPRLLLCPGAGGPALTGILRPAILLERPIDDPVELEMTLRHELCHLRRKDLLAKAVLVCAKAVHWFNPLVWLAAREALREMELACDDMATRGLEKRQREQYGQSILAALAQQNQVATVASTAMAGSAEYVRRRLDNLFTTAGRKRGVALAVAILLASSLLVSCVAPAPQSQSDEIPPVNEEPASLPANETPVTSGPAFVEYPEEPASALGTVTLDRVELRFYEDGDDPYINYAFTNNTTDSIVGLTLAWAAYDLDGNPLELHWFSISDPMTGLGYVHSFKVTEREDDDYLAPGETHDRGGGWSMYDGWHGGQEHDIAYLIPSIVSVEFLEYGLWENPAYESWRGETEGVAFDVEQLKALSTAPWEVTIE